MNRERHRVEFPVLLGASAVLASLLLAGSASAACRGKAPTGLRFERNPGTQVGTLSWRQPRGARKARVRFRVYRDRQVVGQTRRTRIDVRVKPGVTYGFAVRVASRKGKLSPCRSTLRREVAYASPGRPTALGATDVTDSRATLSWVAPKPGDAPIAGYRILRDGVAVRQERSTNAQIPLGSARSYALAVVAVDTQGHQSAASNTVTVSTGHYPPEPPADIGSFKVTDTEVGLSWPAARARSVRVVGYRVYRDGQVLTQVDGLSQLVDNLAPHTDYSFTVAAVDALGYVSEPSPALKVRTELPPPTTGYVHTFLLATTDQSFRDLQAHYDRIGYLYPTYFDCRGDASLTGDDDPLVTGWSQLREVAVMPRLNCQSQTVLHSILTDSTVRARTLDSVVALVRDNGYEGINLDFEAGAATDRDALTSFVSALAGRLHPLGKKVSVEVSAKTTNTTTGRSGFYDYAALGAVADYVFVMCWGLHWSTSGPGSIDDISWATKVADYAATMPNKQRFVIGFPFYGMDWPDGGGPSHRATALEYDDVMALVAEVGATPTLDTATQSWSFGYDRDGSHHDVWFSDRATLATRIAMVRARGMGIGFWHLGEEDQRVWDEPLLAPGTVWP